MPVVAIIDNPVLHRSAYPLHETYFADPNISLEMVVYLMDLYVNAEGFNIDHPIMVRARYQNYPNKPPAKPKAADTWYHKQTGNATKVLAVLTPPEPRRLPLGGWSMEPCYVVDTGAGETWTVGEKEFKSLFRKTKPRPKKNP